MSVQCSTCSRKDSNKLTRITDLDFDGLSYLDKLKSFVELDLDLDAYKNLQMCQICVKNLITSYNFRNTVLDSLQTTKNKDIYSENKVEHPNDLHQEHSMDNTPIKIECAEDVFHNLIQPEEETNLEIDHGETSPKNDKTLCCEHCGTVFKTACHLKEHLTSHTDNKDFKCYFCQKAFSRLSSLKRHMRSHYAPPGQKTRKTPFLCTICGKEFPFSNGAARHMRIHFNVRLHECLVCNKKFSQSTHLLVHMRTHSGEKPYICENCGEKFTLKAGLHKHLKRYHRDNDEFLGSGVAENFCGSNIDVYFK